MPPIAAKIALCLWCDTNAEELANFYVDTFRACGRDAAIKTMMRYNADGPLKTGKVLTTTFTLDGQEIVALNGGPHFSFSPAASLFVTCDDQAEVDLFWEKLLAGGGKESQCGWLTDKFGFSWQIVPKIMGDLLGDKADPKRAGQAMQAMMKMIKLDIAALKAAYDA